METLECIKARASVRSFKPEPVSEEAIGKILEAAVNAPSAGNVQDWEFVIVKDSKGKKALSDAAYGQGFLAQAPVVIVVCSDLKGVFSAYGERGKNLYSIQDTAAAAMCLMLAACDLGLGTCWVGAFSEGKVASLLNLPENVRPLAIIPLGYPAGGPKKPARLGLKKAVHSEKY
jgi:nitroreductase